jgi:hypothetical protein
VKCKPSSCFPGNDKLIAAIDPSSHGEHFILLMYIYEDEVNAKILEPDWSAEKPNPVFEDWKRQH